MTKFPEFGDELETSFRLNPSAKENLKKKKIFVDGNKNTIF